MRVRYGKSMYGGWYAEIVELANKSEGWKHFHKLSDLKQWANDNGLELMVREDNI